MLPPEPLRSTGIAPLPHYYGLLRLPTRPTRGYIFPRPVEDITLGKPGLSGSSADLSARAVPFHPGRPGRCLCSLLPCRRRASPHSEGWPHSIGVTRPNRVRLRYGSCVRRTGLRRRDYPLPPPVCLHGERASAMSTTSQVKRSARLILTHRITPITRNEKNKKE